MFLFNLWKSTAFTFFLKKKIDNLMQDVGNNV